MKFADPKNDLAFKKIFGDENKAANRLSWTKDEQDVYDYIGIHIQDERGRIEYAREEGERAKALKIAKELLNNGIAIDIIVKSTGLTEPEILA